MAGELYCCTLEPTPNSPSILGPKHQVVKSDWTAQVAVPEETWPGSSGTAGAALRGGKLNLDLGQVKVMTWSQLAADTCQKYMIRIGL
jgi:hypothetical protein